MPKPKIVGLYGISGSGKTFLLRKLRERIGDLGFQFFDGSDILNDTVPDGLASFERMSDPEKRHWRQVAIRKIGNQYRDEDKVVVITGHYMFWSALEGNPNIVCTTADLKTYSHILYLDTPVETVSERRLHDPEKSRELVSVQHLERWQEQEKMDLRKVCYEHGILFSLISSDLQVLDRLQSMLLGFKKSSESGNQRALRAKLDDAFGIGRDSIESFVLIDGDKTLTETDTGSLFWELVDHRGCTGTASAPLKSLFGSPLGYSYKAFEQAALLYEESFTQDEFDALCKKVASRTNVRPQFLSFLHTLEKQEHIAIVILTCGLQNIWQGIMDKEGLAGKVCVIGGGRFSEHHIVTGETKAAVVRYIQTSYGKRVLAFGDSRLDLPMLAQADQGYVVVGREEHRSKTMEKALSDAVQQEKFYGSQILLPSTVKPRLTTEELPITSLSDATFLNTVLGEQYMVPSFKVIHATDKNAAKVLMTPMRNAQIEGPSLREVHRKVGHYLAIEYMMGIIDVEEYPISHVQGHSVSGYRLYHEHETMIVAMMRGGEPMALGTNDAIPAARFLHAKIPTDIRFEHLEGLVTVVLVDSVINTGKSIVDFVKHVNKLHATIQIVIITGVAQAESIKVMHELQSSTRYNSLSLVALRVSDNKFTGKGTTDTGNRLFNTTGFA